MRYYLDQNTNSANVIFQERTFNAPGYSLLGSATVYWGGDPNMQRCHCDLQYLRIYWDWIADSEDKMRNLAMMDSNGIHFKNSYNSE